MTAHDPPPSDPVSNAALSSDPTSPPPGVAPAAAPAKPPKRRRIWTKVLGVILLLLILAVVFAPTIAGTAPVRSLILGKVNNNLNGRVQVADWSLGWTGGVRLNDLKVFDAANREILSVGRLTTDLSLLDVVRGNYDAGEVTLEGVSFWVKREADGKLNFD